MITFENRNIIKKTKNISITKNSNKKKNKKKIIDGKY